MSDIDDAVRYARQAKALIDRLPVPLLGPITELLTGLLADNATQSRRAAGLLVARAHKLAVETAIRKVRK